MTDSPPALDPAHVRDYVKSRAGRICDLPGDLLDRMAVHTHGLASLKAAAIRVFDTPKTPDCTAPPCKQRRACALYGCAADMPQPQSERV